jgi:nucleotidyltransferase/DNA polymerase involved in DNA repair
MDSLALLCNLYGQGPVTLRRLREAGARTCDDVLCMEPVKLARVLRTRRPAAERFQREARELAARVGALGGPDPAAPLARGESRAAEDCEAPSSTVVELAAGDTPLRAELFDGLDSAMCIRLRSHGIERVEDLARADALELARALEVPVTRVVRLQFLARRVAEPRSDREEGLRVITLLPRRSQLSAARFSPAESQPARVPVAEEALLEAWAREQEELGTVFAEPSAAVEPSASPEQLEASPAGPFGAPTGATEPSSGPFA